MSDGFDPEELRRSIQLLREQQAKLGLDFGAQIADLEHRLAGVASPQSRGAEGGITGSGAAATSGGVAGGELSVVAGRDIAGTVVVTGDGARVIIGEPPVQITTVAFESALGRYLVHLIARNRHLRLQGIRSGGKFVSIELEHVYITLKTSRSRTAESQEAWLTEERRRAPGELARAERQETAVVSIQEALAEHRRMVVLGDPGSGKTTLLRYLALSYARARAEGTSLVGDRLGLAEDGFLPIFVSLRNLGAYLKVHHPRDDGTDGHGLLLDLVRDSLRNERISLPNDFFDADLETGRAVLMLDGLDEVGDAELRRRVARLTEAWALAYPACRIVVTSRIVGYAGASRLGEGFVTTTIRDFTLADVELFLSHWNRLWLVGQMGPGEDAEHASREQTRQLLEAIRANARVRELAINPLMLTVIALVHRDRVKLPDRRAELYGEAVDVLLGNWDEARGVEELQVLDDRPFDIGDRRLLLQRIALGMQEAGQKEIAADELRARLEAEFFAYTRDPRSAQRAADRFLRAIQERTGLLVEAGPDAYRFSHLTFQEYLAAVEVAEREDYVGYALSRSAESFWREVILLVAGYLSTKSGPKVTRLIRALADRREEPELFHNLVLAVECIRDVGPMRVFDGGVTMRARVHGPGAIAQGPGAVAAGAGGVVVGGGVGTTAATRSPSSTGTVAVVFPPTVPSPPDDLVKACLSQQCVLFAGAGLSMAAGIPSPLQLAQGMFQEFMAQGALNPRLESTLRTLLERHESDVVVEGIVEGSERGAALALEYLRRTLRWTEGTVPGVFPRLSEIGFSGAITTNFDDLLERSFAVQPRQLHTLADTGRLLEALTKNDFFLLKLYGILNRPDSVILTAPRYRDAVIGNQVFGQFLSSLFYSRTLLFAGKSLQGIEEFLGSVPSRSGKPPRHFAVVLDTEPELDVKTSSLGRRFGIEVIPCAAGVAGNGVDRFVERLAERVARSRRVDTAAPARPSTARLARVALENIGPFERLEIELDPGWTLLLGDNGVGKSSVLKAIAVAIVGDEAAPFASRLVRAGATNASITLVTDREDTYRTEIYLSDTSARVSSIPVRPLEKEGWLALGFPPLRTVSWERPASYEGSELGRPSSSDLLPLVRGDTDPRLDHLKAWLLHLDHNIQSWNTTFDIRERYRRLWNEFFRIVERVTPGVNLGPGTVDAVTRQVNVQTDDGQIPIEAVSQGTQSLMGWIGILLERLFEVYGDDNQDPTDRYALILIDEIDAHMHPHWQHVLIGTLKELFPNAQFVASSHSALLVSGLAKEEVLVFTRDDSEGRRVKVAQPPGDLKGWRVDQILTSAAFGLAGARDPETLHDLELYTELVAQDSPAEPGKLAALAEKLKIRLPTEGERAYARRAFEIVQGYARSQMEGMSAEDKRRVTEEIKVQLQEGITGSRRPM